MRRSLSILVFVGAALAGPEPAAGQVAQSYAVSRLSVGEAVRVQAPGVTVEDGRVSEVSPETLYVLEGGQEWLIDVADIERLEVQRRPVVQSILVFGAVGALAGWGAGKFKEDTPFIPFVAGGVASGAIFGMTQVRWQVTFPR